MRQSFAVIGGGVLGLTVALRLLQRGQAVEVFEREALPGGLAAGFDLNEGQPGHQPIWLDRFYHHIFTSDTAFIALADELGLKDEILWRNPPTVTLLGGQVYRLDSARSLLNFTPMSPIGRIRTGIGLALLRALPNPRLLEGRTTGAWIRGVMGSSSYNTVWGPLLQGKFADAADEVALPWFWGRVHDRSPKLGYLQGGFQRFYDRLAIKVEGAGGTLRFQTAVRQVAPEPKGGLSVTSSPATSPRPARTLHFDQVISTLPTALNWQIAPDLRRGAYARRYQWGQAIGAHCLIIALDRPLTGSYWVNINDSGYPFLVLVEHTNFMPASDYEGRHLIYLGNYRAMSDPLFKQSKDEVLREFLPHLTKLNPAFAADWVQESWLFAAPFAQPVVTREYKEHIPPFDTPLPGFSIANMYQVYPHDRGQNYSIVLAEALITHLARQQHIPPVAEGAK